MLRFSSGPSALSFKGLRLHCSPARASRRTGCGSSLPPSPSIPPPATNSRRWRRRQRGDMQIHLRTQRACAKIRWPQLLVSPSAWLQLNKVICLDKHGETLCIFRHFYRVGMSVFNPSLPSHLDFPFTVCPHVQPCALFMNDHILFGTFHSVFPFPLVGLEQPLLHNPTPTSRPSPSTPTANPCPEA